MSIFGNGGIEEKASDSAQCYSSGCVHGRKKRKREGAWEGKRNPRTDCLEGRKGPFYCGIA